MNQPQTIPNIQVLNLHETSFREQLGVMLQMQNEMNSMVVADWNHRGLAWHRAIYVEAAEFLEHLGTWKWWKKGRPDFSEANMELVDIWHFALSWYIERFGQPLQSEALHTAIARRVKDSLSRLDSNMATLPEDALNELRHQAVDQLVHKAGSRLFDTESFVILMAANGMTFDALFQLYVGKNVLNRFRQENGYKAGNYIKIWNGQEDNVHLNAILEDLGRAAVPAADLPALVHKELSERYQALALGIRNS